MSTLVLVLGVFVVCADAAKILMIPMNMNSHVLYFSRLGEGLAKLGYEIEILVPSNSPSKPRHDPKNNITVTLYKVNGSEPVYNTREISESIMEAATTRSSYKKFYLSYTVHTRAMVELERDCECLLENTKLLEEIENKGFQFAIMDSGPTSCLYLIPQSMRIPYASIALPAAALQYRVPRLPSFVPSCVSTSSDEMSFLERLAQFCFFEMSMIAFYSKSTKYFADKYFPNKNITSQTAMALIRGSSLFFYMEDLTLGYPSPHMPNTLSIGDIMARDSEKPVPENLNTFLNDSLDGVIIVSLGSYFEYLPEHLTFELCDAFSRTKFRVIWKTKNDTACRHTNVLTTPWIPQNDLLAHNKVRAMITHGGLNSMMEAIYHAKPVIVFPLITDQPWNAATAARRGYGIRMNISDFSSDDLASNIEKVVTDPTFSSSIKKASAIFRNKPDTPAERVSHRINHVIEHGDEHLRTKAFNLWLFQYLMFDIFAFLVFVFVVLTAISYCGLAYICKIFAQRLRLKKTKIA